MLRIISVTSVFIFTGMLMINQNVVQQAPSFPTNVPLANETSNLMFMPAACFESENSPIQATSKSTADNANDLERVLLDSDPGNTLYGWNWDVILLLFYMLAILVESVRFVQRGGERPGWRSRVTNWCSSKLDPHPRVRKLFAYIFLAYLATGIGISAAATANTSNYILDLRGWMDKSGWIQKENGVNPENDATDFGQLVPIFMVSMVVFGILQLISGTSDTS